MSAAEVSPTAGRGLPRWIEAPLAAAGLLLAVPLLLPAMLAIRLGSPGPALFRQQRMGRGGRPFVLLKLRSMRISEPGPGVTRRDDVRITPLGAFLRRSKLDELPELWNVLRGDMALVGPRPEVPEFVDLGDPTWRRVLALRPGLTDPVTLTLRDEERLLADLPGDPETAYRRFLLPRKLAGNLAYQERRGWRSDFLVLLWTALKILLPGVPLPASLRLAEFEFEARSDRDRASRGTPSR